LDHGARLEEGNVIQEAVELLWWLRRNSFTQHIIGSDAPTVMVFSRPNGNVIDLAHIRGEDRTEAARIPFDEHASIWRPRFAVWHYYGHIIETLRQLVALSPPDSPNAPTVSYALPRAGEPPPLMVRDEERRQKTICRAPANVSARACRRFDQFRRADLSLG
jgi:hypothetical protein